MKLRVFEPNRSLNCLTLRLIPKHTPILVLHHHLLLCREIFDAPNASLGEDTSSESEIETQNNPNPKLQPSISRYGRNRIPSRLLREAEEGARLVLEGKDDEPTYSEAMPSPDRRKWEAAMKDEYDSLQRTKLGL
jgi:hypothetical protein